MVIAHLHREHAFAVLASDAKASNIRMSVLDSVCTSLADGLFDVRNSCCWNSALLCKVDHFMAGMPHRLGCAWKFLDEVAQSCLAFASFRIGLAARPYVCPYAHIDKRCTIVQPRVVGAVRIGLSAPNDYLRTSHVGVVSGDCRTHDSCIGSLDARLCANLATIEVFSVALRGKVVGHLCYAT